ncbi:unnamed protein product [Phyllotreta striolata]|uniref:UDP-glucuronosyltransferase n=1 Tax=Phyllotreta striolata TaxID=444603 RepID=A0A9N9TUK7_PHYSR|nr:unnamed protein product [Phyllotreta striolata]
MKIPPLILLLVVTLTVVNGSKILGIFTSPGYSQYILGERLLELLAKRGHHVTMISEFEPKEPIQNYVTLKLDKSGSFHDTFDLTEWQTKNNYQSTIEFLELCKYYTEIPLKQSQIQEFIRSNETFDLVIVENFCNEAHVGFAGHFGAPVVIFSSQPMHEWSSHFVGNVNLPSISTNSLSSLTNRMGFYERLQSFCLNLFYSIYKELYFYPEQQELMDKYFPNKMDLKNLTQNVEMLLVFGHPLTTEPSLLTSAVVEVGGFHIKPRKLPAEIQTFLNGAKQGAILVSLGSNVPCQLLTKEQLNAFLNAFRKLSHSILWKCDMDVPNKPSNVLFSKWLPQTDVLAHPNVIAFVTHNGLLSTTEAMYYGVPMISIPVFGDQMKNAARAVKLGVAQKLNIIDLKEEDLLETMKNVAQNPQFRNKMKILSQMFRDQPSSPADRALNSIEYVLKYRPGKYLRSPALDLFWYELYSVDVVLFILGLFVTINLLLLFVIRKLLYAKRISKRKTA